MGKTLVLLLLSVFFSGTTAAFAQVPIERVKDRDRVRIGIVAEGGGLVIPNGKGLGTLGLQGQLGVQINDRYGICIIPSLGAIMGDARGLYVGGAVLADFTYTELFSIGVGPDIASFFDMDNHKIAGGSLYGARIHFAYYPMLWRRDHTVRRKSVVIGLDLRFLGGGAALVERNSSQSSGFVFAPTMTFGYQEF